MTPARDQVQLIAYADRLGGDLPGLRRLLDEHFAGVFGGVHVLPFFTPFDGADTGFDPVDHTAVDPRLGGWDDVAALSRDRDVVADVIVNHVSADSAAFRDVAERGDASPHAPMFLTFSSVFPDGATEDQLTAIYRPRPGLPFTPVRWGGARRLAWTTFTPSQLDIDVRSGPGRAYLRSILDALAAAGVAMVRLDAVGYAVKTPGTSSFMTPQTFGFIEDFTAEARERGLEVLVEVHSYYRRQVEIAERVDRVYDFALPPLLLHAFYTGDAAPLARWLRVRPTNAVTVLDTHDGIGVVDVGPDAGAADPGAPEAAGLLTPAEIDALVEGIHTRTGGASRQATGYAASNLDVYQVNSTYYDALGRDDRAYLAARAIQLLTPGIPQVYYVGALAGHNDLDLLRRTGVGRDINRHHYTAAEVAAELRRPVVVALCALARWRNTFDVFGDSPLQVALSADDHVITLVRGTEDHHARLVVDLRTTATTLTWAADGVTHRTDDLLADPPVLCPTPPPVL